MEKLVVLDRQTALSLSPPVVEDFISGADNPEVLDFINHSRTLVKSYIDGSKQAWTPGRALEPLVAASNIRDVVYHNSLLLSRLSKLDDPDSLSVEMARDEALLLETAAPLFYGRKKRRLLDGSQQSLKSIYQALPLDHPLRPQLDLDCWFFRSRHDDRIDKVELTDGVLAAFSALVPLLRDSDPKLLTAYSAGLRVLDERLSIDKLRQGNFWLPNTVFDERYNLSKERWRKVSIFVALPVTLIFSKDFRAKQEQLFQDLVYHHIPACITAVQSA